MSANYRFACMNKVWVRRPLMILLTLPLTIYVLGQILYEEFPGFIQEWLRAWRGDV